MDYVVYFAQSDQTGLIKIGATYQVENRMKLLRSKRQNRTVTLLATIPGRRPLETRFLRHFWDLHVGGEWFEPTARILDVVARIRAGAFDVAELPIGPNPILSAAGIAYHAKRRAEAVASAA